MRRILTVLSALALGAALLSPAAGAQDLFDGGRLSGGSTQLIPGNLPVPGGELREIDGTVDLERFAGTWYQVAALPQPYSLQCAHNTTAEYGVIDESTISVRNSCGTLFGSRSGIEGTATVRSGASLRVNFPGVPFQDPEGPVNYRVTHLEEDYSLAIVGDPYRLSGFVLSRTPDLSPETWSRVRGIVESRGWNSCLFLTVPMEGGRGDTAPLCTQ
ncbi:MAG: lipocalin family protein [Corynebacterium humireducens]|jgi:apolipoprotein D and lipocalin family protein|uniref:Lipocalin family protein n=1 Tax=Corynebacterium humireducens TaxID=1223514 RepID=A0A7X6PL27_9CORY|nr:lipocalin family protein [Corynebacterium humireducens]